MLLEPMTISEARDLRDMLIASYEKANRKLKAQLSVVILNLMSKISEAEKGDYDETRETA